jgi:uncharacterized protein (TIGR03067 family)
MWKWKRFGGRSLALSRRTALLLLLLSIGAAGSPPAKPPVDLQGKWKLRGSNRLLGALEIRANGTYSYAVLPNYRETGKFVLDLKNQTWIDLSITTGPNKGKTTKGIFRIENSKLRLCLGKLGGQRPEGFNNDPKLGVILWDGTKAQ